MNDGRVFFTLYVTALSMGLAYGTHAPLIPVFARDMLGANYTEVGLIGMSNYLPYAFFPFFVGILLDRFNRMLILLLGLVMALTSIAALSMVDSIMYLALLRGVSGIAHAFFWPSAESMIVGKGVKSISRFTLLWVVGYMVGPLIGSSLFNLGYTMLFIYSSLMILPALVCISITYKGIDYANRRISIRGIKSILRDRILLALMIMYYSASFAIVLSILPSYMNDNGIDEQSIGYLFFVFGIARLITLTTVHKIAALEGKGIAIASIVIALAMLNIYMYVTPYTISLSMLAFGFAFSVYFPVTLSMMARGVSSSLVGSIVGVYETIFGIGWASAPLLSGITADTLGTDTPYLLIFILGIGLTALYILKGDLHRTSS
jgi:DHA1 family multidrug resistance protein-like MFS transporter